MNKLVRLVLTVLLVGFVAYRLDWADVGQRFAQLNIWFWGAGVLILVATQIVSAYRWQFFAKELNFERSVPQLAGFYYIGMYFSLVLPTSVGGDVVRAWYLDGGSGRKLAAFGAVLLDRLNGLLVLISIALVATLFCPLDLPDWITWTVLGIACGAFGGMALLPLLARWRGPGSQQIQRIHRTVRLLHSPKILWITTLLSTVVQVANIAIVWLIGMALGVDIPGAFYWVLVPLMSLLMLVPITVNGMGVRELAMVVLLAPLGVSKGTAEALAILWFFNGVAVSLFGGLVYLFGHFSKPVAPAETPDEDVIHGPVDCYPDQGRAGQLDKAA